MSSAEIKQNEQLIIQYEKEKKVLETETSLLKEGRALQKVSNFKIEQQDVLNQLQNLKAVLRSNNLNTMILNAVGVSPRNLNVRTLMSAVERNDFKAFTAEKIQINGKKKLKYTARRPLTPDDLSPSMLEEVSKINF